MVIEQGCLKANRSLTSVQEGASIVSETLGSESGVVTQSVRLYVEALQHPEFVCKLLTDTKGVKGAVIHEKGVLLEFEGDQEAQAGLLKILVDCNVQPTRFVEQKMDLEDLFLSLTEGKVQ